MPFSLYKSTPTFQRLMALTKKKKEDLILRYVKDVETVTTSLEDHIEKLDELIGCMKRASLKCKSSKKLILPESMK